MAEKQRDPTMQAIARLSSMQAVALAVAWPVMLVALPYAIALVRRAIVMLTAPRDNGFHAMVGFHMRVASWPALIAVVAVPPIVFLYAWWMARRT